MTQPRCILAPTDLSGPARHAAERAALLARADSARLVLLHVVNLSALESLRHILDQGLEDNLEERLMSESEQELSALAAHVQEHFAVTAAIQVAVGQVLDAIVATGERLGADLLVMGARGAGFLRDLLLGSTTERVLRKTRSPVLAVKQPPRGPYRKVLVPVDFSAHSRAAMKAARQLFPEAGIGVVHVFEVPFEGKMQFAGVDDDTLHLYRIAARRKAQEDLSRFLADFPGVEGEIRHGDIASRILEQEQERDADLIVMGKHGRTLVEELLLGSVTKHVLAHSSCDVLVVGG